ncbi:HAD family hydrolase [Chungangia koreensis]|uniref:HAD family hydrolase n=1 Tax=Chungangia koreensis TaxID=752657 RepID=A0ABV8X582_9LACT
MIRAIVFDLDGTLLNREESLLRFAEDQYDRLHTQFGGLSKQEFVTNLIEMDCRGYVWKDEVYRRMVSKFGFSISWEELLTDYKENFYRHCVPFSNMGEMFEGLKGFRLGMITNGLQDVQFSNIKALGLDRLLDVILISESEGVAKPDLEIFKRAAERLGVQTDECVFVGDHPDKDIRAAQNAGMQAVWKRDPNYEAPEVNYIVEDLVEVVSILNRINQYQSQD